MMRFKGRLCYRAFKKTPAAPTGELRQTSSPEGGFYANFPPRRPSLRQNPSLYDDNLYDQGMTMASSISSQLRPDETILYQTGLRPVILWICVPGLLFCAGILVLVALDFSGFLEVVSQRDLNRSTGGSDVALYKLMAMSLGMILGLYICVKWLYDYCRTEVAVTNQRIIGNIPTAWLPFRLQSLDLPLADLQKVATENYGGASYGYVIATGGLGRKTIFRNFKAPEELRRQIIQAGGLTDVPQG